MKAQAYRSNQRMRPARRDSFFQKKEEGGFFSSFGIQPKLSIGKSGDHYEQEADAMAERVVQGKIQRKCDACEGEEQLAQPILMNPGGYSRGIVDDDVQRIQSPMQMNSQVASLPVVPADRNRIMPSRQTGKKLTNLKGNIGRAPAAFISRETQDSGWQQVEGEQREIRVERNSFPGKCFREPKGQTTKEAGINMEKAFFKINYCKGEGRLWAEGEMSYGKAIEEAEQAIDKFTDNPTRAGFKELTDKLKQIGPSGAIEFGGQWKQWQAKLYAEGSVNIAEGITGTTGVVVGTKDIWGGFAVTKGNSLPFPGGSEGARGGAELPPAAHVFGGISHDLFSGGSTESKKRNSSLDPNCYVCICPPPVLVNRCFARSIDSEGNPLSKMLYFPLFYQKATATPRLGWEENYQSMLNTIVSKIKEGYRVVRIEGRTSPEGGLDQNKGGEFEGNIKLAEKRANRASQDLRRRIQANMSIMRTDAPHRKMLEKVLQGSIAVEGHAPGNTSSSAELFGSNAQGEVKNRDLLQHLLNVLQVSEEGVDPLANEHVIGQGLPEGISNEIAAEAEAFRSGKREDVTIGKRERLETIFRPFRRAIIVLEPAPKIMSGVQKYISDDEVICTDGHNRLMESLPRSSDLFTTGNCDQEDA